MSRETVEVVGLWFAGFNEEGMPTLDVCDESIEIGNVPEFPVQGPYHGHEGVRRWVSDLFDVLEEARLELDEAIDAEDGETVVTVQRVLARTRHTRLPITFRWAAVWTIRAGKVVHLQGYVGKTRALKAVGLSE